MAIEFNNNVYGNQIYYADPTEWSWALIWEGFYTEVLVPLEGLSSGVYWGGYSVTIWLLFR